MILSQTANHLLEKALTKATLYTTYRKMVQKMAENEDTTGNDKSEALIDYTKLNDKRMNRLDKTIKIAHADAEIIKIYDTKTTWLIVTESWCGDAAQTLPIMNKIATLNTNIDIKIILRDENHSFMDYFFDGVMGIPKLLIIDAETKEVLHSWGPRPSKATKMVTEFKEKHGKLTPQFKQDLQVWYNKDKGANTIQDLVAFLR